MIHSSGCLWPFGIVGKLPDSESGGHRFVSEGYFLSLTKVCLLAASSLLLFSLPWTNLLVYKLNFSIYNVGCIFLGPTRFQSKIFLSRLPPMIPKGSVEPSSFAGPRAFPEWGQGVSEGRVVSPWEAGSALSVTGIRPPSSMNWRIWVRLRVAVGFDSHTCFATKTNVTKYQWIM